MSSIEDIKAKLVELTDVVNAFQVAAPVIDPVIAKVEGEVAAIDAELKAAETPVADATVDPATI